ncbi:MAG: ABC transporter ATP-binding protein [Candidatus Acidiferrales bacterium]
MLNALPPELRWLFPKVKPQFPLHAASFLCLTVASLLALVMPLSIRWLIDSILPTHNLHMLVIAIGLIFGSYEGRAVLHVVGGYLTFRATQGTALDLRMSLLRHLGSLSAEHFDRTPVGELLYPFERPIDEISYFGADLLPSILRTAIAAAVTLSAMTALSPILTLVVFPLVPAFLLLRHRYRARISHQADLVQMARNRFSGFLQEHLAAMTQIQLLRQTASQERKASALLANAIGSQGALYKAGALFSAFSNLAIVTGIAVILTGGSLMVFRGQLTTGTLVAFYSLGVQLFEPLSTAMEMYARAQRTFSSIRQIQNVLDTVPAVGEHGQAKPIASGVPAHAAFRNVSFHYERCSTSIRIPSLDILQGERVAIAGPNGAGKSTVGKLLARLYDVQSGEILIAGSNVRALTLASLRSSVCYLPAQPVLFHRSIGDNLRIGRTEATCGELEQVLRIVELTKYLEGYPDSLEEWIDPGASNLSHGERQRVAIARALLQRPRILILDETTSSLDPNSEESIVQAIGQRLPESTVILVSHRLPALAWTGRILVMRAGQIVEDSKPSVPSLAAGCQDSA